jgi:hypothetical protein
VSPGSAPPSYRVPVPNAFTINTVGLLSEGGWPFPLSIDCRRLPDGPLDVHLTAIGVTQVADLVEKYAGPTCVVFDVGHYQFRPDSRSELLDLEEVARARNVEVASYDVEWAAPLPAPGEKNLISVATKDLTRLVADLHTYDFHLVDAPRRLQGSDVENLMLQAHTSAPTDPPLLARLGWATLEMDVHDDCYARVVSRLGSFVSDVIARLISTLAGTVMSRAGLEPLVAPPNAQVLEPLIVPGVAWIAPQQLANVHGSNLTLGWSLQRWQLGLRPPDDAQQTLLYDMAAQRWRWL